MLEGTAVGPMERVEHCLDALAAIVARERIACELRLGGCWELVHRRDSDSRRTLWRDGDTWLCVERHGAGGHGRSGRAGVGARSRRTRRRREPARGCPRCSPSSPAVPRACAWRTAACDADHVVVALNGYTAALLTLPIRLGAALTLALGTDPIGERQRSPSSASATPCRSTPPTCPISGVGRPPTGASSSAPASSTAPTCRASRCTTPRRGDAGRLEERVGRPAPRPRPAPGSSRAGAARSRSRRNARRCSSRLPGASGVIVYAGCAGHGVALGVRVGQLVTEAIVDGVPLPSWGALPGAPQG